MINLADLFFWTGCKNRVGFPNIRGDELRNNLSGYNGASAGATLATPPFSVPDSSPPVVVPVDFVFPGDELGLYDPSIFGFRIPDLDPPIQKIQLSIRIHWAAAAAGSRTMGTLQNATFPASFNDIVGVFPDSGDPAVGLTYTAAGPIFPTVAGQFYQMIAAQTSGAPLDISLAVFSIGVIR